MSKTDKIEQIFDDDIVERNSWKFQYDDEELIFQMAFHVNLNKFDWKFGFENFFVLFFSFRVQEMKNEKICISAESSKRFV